ncbi:helix-turn-helix domain-containing protein [Streptomyces canus]|uniref:PucR family transcriptional regulator n=1 Tax=Streptomyces canus TaxID=58343 RepID=UPI002250203A|nr:helix-turn-helix domain-containing protein [Streptomyces canus]MCX4862214.1 helix-turn-helix domain-containing protein [Streptomyces canus]WSW32692.1 helix-turn-helix domain-containing protein [Streptomyces canus]
MTGDSGLPAGRAIDSRFHEPAPAPALASGCEFDEEDRTRLRTIASRAAGDGTPLRELIATHLNAHCTTWPPPSPKGQAAQEAATATVTDVLQLMRDVAVTLADGYEAAHRAAIRREEEVRQAFIDGLLRGPGDLGRLAEQAHRIGFQLTGPHRVAVAQAKSPFAAADPATRYAEEAMTSHHEGPAPLVTAKDGRLICVSAGDSATACEHFAEQVHRSAARNPRIAISRPRPGANGVVRSYREACETLDLGGRLGLQRSVIHSTDLLVYQVLGRDQAAITDLVATVLGGLKQARGGPAPLLDTLTAYFDSGCAHTATARLLGLSVRAVSYRIARIRTLTGYDPTVPEQRYTLQTATLGARLLNWPAHPLQPLD